MTFLEFFEALLGCAEVKSCQSVRSRCQSLSETHGPAESVRMPLGEECRDSPVLAMPQASPVVSPTVHPGSHPKVPRRFSCRLMKLKCWLLFCHLAEYHLRFYVLIFPLLYPVNRIYATDPLQCASSGKSECVLSPAWTPQCASCFIYGTEPVTITQNAFEQKYNFIIIIYVNTN